MSVLKEIWDMLVVQKVVISKAYIDTLVLVGFYQTIYTLVAYIATRQHIGKIHRKRNDLTNKVIEAYINTNIDTKREAAKTQEDYEMLINNYHRIIKEQKAMSKYSCLGIIILFLGAVLFFRVSLGTLQTNIIQLTASITAIAFVFYNNSVLEKINILNRHIRKTLNKMRTLFILNTLLTVYLGAMYMIK